MYRAATIFAHMYGKEEALKHGFRASQIHEGGFQAVMATASPLEDIAMNLGHNLAYLNLGMMSYMQANPDDKKNFCYQSTEATNADLLLLFDIGDYMVGGFNSNNFANQLKIMNIKFMQQMEDCNYTQFLIALDGMLNNIPNAVASLMNTATQIGTGWSSQDQSIYIAVDMFKKGWNASNANHGEEKFKLYGQGFQLAMSQILKISAPAITVEATPTSA